MKAEHLEMDNSEITTEKQLTKKDIWERKLLDFSLRNSLLNIGQRRRIVRFIGIKADKVEDFLQDGVEFSIWHNPAKDKTADDRAAVVAETIYTGFISLASSVNADGIKYINITEDFTEV